MQPKIIAHSSPSVHLLSRDGSSLFQKKIRGYKTQVMLGVDLTPQVREALTDVGYELGAIPPDSELLVWIPQNAQAAATRLIQIVFKIRDLTGLPVRPPHTNEGSDILFTPSNQVDPTVHEFLTNRGVKGFLTIDRNERKRYYWWHYNAEGEWRPVVWENNLPDHFATDLVLIVDPSKEPW